jgi:SAM-dependent methyltransferase
MAWAHARGTHHKPKKKKKAKKRTMAQAADKFDLYLQSVQDPPFEVRFLKRAFKDAYGRTPTRLREDFCGTAKVCCEWTRTKGNEAWGVDLDGETLEWGRENNVGTLKPAHAARVHLLQDNVLSVETPKVDIIAAQNFSYYIFKERELLREYFATARKFLDDEGVLVVDMLGGPEVQQDEEEEEREIDGDDYDFTYVWEQARFDPVTNNALFHIHFDFEDGSRLKKAFTYDWRLWSIPEVREIMAEAGFSQTTVYWEASDEDGDGNGRYYKTESAPADLTWLCYVVAKR